MKKLNQKGVTLIALIITVIVLLILASVATYSGMDIIESSKVTTFTAEMKIMQTQVNSLYDQWKSGDINKDEIGKSLDYNAEVQEQTSKVLVTELDITDTTGYRYFDQETIQSLKIEGVKQEFFINIEKREVVSYKGLRYKGDMYYTLTQLPDGLYNVDYNRKQGNLTFETSTEVLEGVGKIYIKNIEYDRYVNRWQIQYREKADDDEKENIWKTTEEFVGSEYTLDIPTDGILKEYQIRVIHEDDIASETKNVQILKVGDYVNYDPTNGGKIEIEYTSQQGTYHIEQADVIEDTSENMKEGNGHSVQTFSVSANTEGWRILGIDENTNEILLISADILDNKKFYIRGQTGYEWGIRELNNISEIYGHGKGATRGKNDN